jgi:hypothetical protein
MKRAQPLSMMLPQAAQGWQTQTPQVIEGWLSS